jgi:hypothetical protein
MNEPKRGRPHRTTEEKREQLIAKTTKQAENALEIKDSDSLFGRGSKYNFPNARMQLIEQDDEKRAFVAKAVMNNLVFFNKGIQEPVKSDEQLCERLNWFFTECARTQQIPNVEKLANAIGVSRNTLLRWSTGELPGFSSVTKNIAYQAKQILASIDAELAQEGKSQPVVYMFRAKNFYEMRDQQEVVVTPNTGTIESADLATIEAKYAELPEDFDE